MSFLNVYLWFHEALKTIPWTIAMWVTFLILVTVHGDILMTYQVRHAIGTHVRNIVGHPMLGVASYHGLGTTSSSVPVDCDCACVPRKFEGIDPVPACTAPQVDRNYVNLNGKVSGAHFAWMNQEALRKRMFEEKQAEMALVRFERKTTSFLHRRWAKRFQFRNQSATAFIPLSTGRTHALGPGDIGRRHLVLAPKRSPAGSLERRLPRAGEPAG